MAEGPRQPGETEEQRIAREALERQRNRLDTEMRGENPDGNPSGLAAPPLQPDYNREPNDPAVMAGVDRVGIEADPERLARQDQDHTAQNGPNAQDLRDARSRTDSPYVQEKKIFDGIMSGSGAGLYAGKFDGYGQDSDGLTPQEREDRRLSAALQAADSYAEAIAYQSQQLYTQMQATAKTLLAEAKAEQSAIQQEYDQVTGELNTARTDLAQKEAAYAPVAAQQEVVTAKQEAVTQAQATADQAAQTLQAAQTDAATAETEMKAAQAEAQQGIEEISPNGRNKPAVEMTHALATFYLENPAMVDDEGSVYTRVFQGESNEYVKISGGNGTDRTGEKVTLTQEQIAALHQTQKDGNSYVYVNSSGQKQEITDPAKVEQLKQHEEWIKGVQDVREDQVYGGGAKCTAEEAALVEKFKRSDEATEKNAQATFSLDAAQKRYQLAETALSDAKTELKSAQEKLAELEKQAGVSAEDLQAARDKVKALEHKQAEVQERLDRAKERVGAVKRFNDRLENDSELREKFENGTITKDELNQLTSGLDAKDKAVLQRDIDRWDQNVQALKKQGPEAAAVAANATTSGTTETVAAHDQEPESVTQTVSAAESGAAATLASASTGTADTTGTDEQLNLDTPDYTLAEAEISQTKAQAEVEALARTGAAMTQERYEQLSRMPGISQTELDKMLAENNIEVDNQLVPDTPETVLHQAASLTASLATGQYVLTDFKLLGVKGAQISAISDPISQRDMSGVPPSHGSFAETLEPPPGVESASYAYNPREQYPNVAFAAERFQKAQMVEQPAPGTGGLTPAQMQQLEMQRLQREAALLAQQQGGTAGGNASNTDLKPTSGGFTNMG